MSTSDPIDVEALDRARKRAGLSWKALADQAGIDVKTLKRARDTNGCSSTTRARLESVAVLGLTAGVLNPSLREQAPELKLGRHELATGEVSYLVGKEALYESAEALCGMLMERVRIAVSCNAPRATRKFVGALAARMGERLRDHPKSEVQLDVTFVVDPEEVKRDEFRTHMAWRNEVMETEGVSEKHIRFRVIEAKPLPSFDVFVVDRVHAQIGFARHGQKGEIFRAIEFRNQPGVVTDLADWCDALMAKGRDYHEWAAPVHKKVARLRPRSG